MSTCVPVRCSVTRNDVHRRLFPWQPCCVLHNAITLPCHVSKQCNRCVRWHPFTLSIFFFLLFLIVITNGRLQLRSNSRNLWAISAYFQHINEHSYPLACAVAIYGITYIPLPISVVARSKAWICGSLLAGIAGSNPARDVIVCCECWVLPGRGICIGLTTRPEGSFRVWCVWVWSWSLDNEEALAHWRLLRH